MNRPLYLSIDVESDGPIPGLYSMLQFGVAAMDLTAPNPRKPSATFEANLCRLPGARQSPHTMKWWARQKGAYEKTRIGMKPPEKVMPQFLQWIYSLQRRCVIVGYPVTFDFQFVYWYTMAFGGLADGERCPFGMQGMDIKTMAAVALNLDYPQVSKRRMPRRWFEGAPPHTHDGLDDAIGQGVLFVNMMLGSDTEEWAHEDVL